MLSYCPLLWHWTFVITLRSNSQATLIGLRVGAITMLSDLVKTLVAAVVITIALSVALYVGLGINVIELVQTAL